MAIKKKMDALLMACDAVSVLSSPPSSPCASSTYDIHTQKICADCQTVKSVKWRLARRRMIMARQVKINTVWVCNACGLYWRRHGRKRPLHLPLQTLVKRLKY